MIAPRVCGSRETADGEPCLHPALPSSDHCAAGHPRQPQAPVAQAPATVAPEVAAADLEDLVVPPPIELVIVGPNTRDNKFHIHKKGCADLAKGEYRRLRAQSWSASFSTEHDLVEAIWGDILAEREYTGDGEWETLRSEQRFFPCVPRLPLG